MKAISIDVYKALGAYIPLIVANCIILERAEALRREKSSGKSMLDGFGMGLGFAFALTCLGTVREVLGAGTFLGFRCSARISSPGCFSCCLRADSSRLQSGC